MGHVTLTTAISGWFVIHRLGLAMINLCAKFKVCVSAHYEDRKGDAKSRNDGLVWVVRIILTYKAKASHCNKERICSN